MNMSQISEMVVDPKLPFRIDILERAVLAAIAEMSDAPEGKVGSARALFSAVREMGAEAYRGTVEAMETAMELGSDEMSAEEELMLREAAVEPAARNAEEQVMRQMCRMSLLRLGRMLAPPSEAPEI